MLCDFPVAPPEYTTFNNTQITITPTISGTNFPSSTASPATLTATAGHNDSLSKGAPGTVTSGLTYQYSLVLACGSSGYTGDLGLSALTITDTFPANFTYSSYDTGTKKLPGTFTYDASSSTLTYSDPTGTTCGNPSLYTNLGNVGNLVQILVNGTAAQNGVADPAGTKICNSASAVFTYLDGVTASSSPPAVCSTVAGRVPSAFLGKGADASTFGNAGQYRFPADKTAYLYTYPGNWDQTGTSATFVVQLNTTVPNAGADFAVQDPLPCLTNFANQVYSSPAPGAPYCSAPAFIPTVITAASFTPSPSDAVTLVHTDGTTATVGYTAGTGWVIPTSPAVAEIDFPPFPEEGKNTGQITFSIQGYAAPETSATSSVPGNPSLLTNIARGQAYEVGQNTLLVPEQTAKNSIMVVSPVEPSGTVVRPVISSGYDGNCTEHVSFTTIGAPFPDSIEIASAPSEAIYLDYLAPAGATGISNEKVAFTLQQVHSGGYWHQMGFLANGQKYVTPTIAPTVTPNYNGTGRTLYRWVIPAGTIAVPGDYALSRPNNLIVSLGPGCAGTYQNDYTVGYGAPVTSCYLGFYYGVSTAVPPKDPSADPDLRANGTPLSNNYCGNSAPLVVAPVNPGFRVDKTVQGNLDGRPVRSGGIGNVSPSGGTATYNVTFTNSGGANLANPVLYDILPVVGDTAASSLAARNSQFPVTLTSVGPLPAGVTVSYSTARNPCRVEVLPTNPGCVNDWSTTPPASLSSVTALRFGYAGSVVVNGAAGVNSFNVPFTVATPPSAPGSVAWNSVGTTAYAGVGGALIAAAESSTTGLQAQLGPTIVKASTTPSFTKAGDTVSYTYTVTNNTGVPLTKVGVVDSLIGAPAGDVAPAASCQSLSGPSASCSGADTTLQPGQSATFVATAAATQGDLDQGSLADSATVSATPPTGGLLTNTSNPVTIPAVQTSGISLSKSATPSTVTDAGQTVAFTYAVANNGNVTLTAVKVNEKAFSGTGTAPVPSCPAPTVPPNSVMHCTATYTVTQADIDAGSVTNTATATGTPPSGPPLTSVPSTATVTVPSNGAIHIVKSASPSDPVAYLAGQAITYSYVVTNTGNVTLDHVAVNETTFTGAGPTPAPQCPSSTLAPGAQVTCTAGYTLTQADIDAGSLTNVANATGDPPVGPQVLATASSVTIPEAAKPGLTLVKTASPATVTDPGQTVAYTFVVTNTGNVSLKDMAVTETAFSGTGSPPDLSCPSSAAVMLPGAEVTCTATYKVTQADIDAGHVSNTATASALPPSPSAVTSAPSTATVTAPGAGAIKLVKSASPSDVTSFTAGRLITYSYVVSNTGNVTLDHVAVHETTFTGRGPAPVPACPSPATLAPGGQLVCSAPYTLTQGDIDAGRITNVANATGDAPSGSQVIAEASSVTIPQAPAPAVTVVKTADPTAVSSVGQKVTYTFKVTNTGNVTLTDVAVTEVAFSGTGPRPVPSCPVGIASMLPGIEVTCAATYMTTQVDLNAGTIANTATAGGTPPSGPAIASPPSSAPVTVSAFGGPNNLTPTPPPPATPNPPINSLPRTGAPHLRELLLAGDAFLLLAMAIRIVLRRPRPTQ
jgi:uncharacterized repeat protein (TIGR01451 family)